MQYKKLLKLNKNLIKRNLTQIYQQQQGWFQQKRQTPELTKNNWFFKRLKSTTITRQLNGHQKIQIKTSCHYLWQTKTAPNYYNKNTSRHLCNTINMVTTEEAVKYLEIPDKSENDKKHYK